ncbi:glycosyl hydrolase 115 family protein [Ferruginibacter sp. HRS2-29]|uniref:glycosyl hydrolase 115 family protein n=1 Tax=Ferruginibacter sp. HRS2-29 TaxID=2487334 RepID=UPI0020CF9E94|nr:glycosyl hydrolase 115 family protein [Ferruginibacter sp. HRS2-29]MCP9753457.1 glycosyhydrolase [Ferruginibacter sp. HRS2-29]
MIKNLIVLALLLALNTTKSVAQLISVGKTNFDLSTASIVIDKNDLPLVKKSAELLQQDIQAVTGKKIQILYSLSPSTKNNIIIGSINNSGILQKLAARNKPVGTSLKNKWEAYEIRTVENNLIIAGSDRRGTAYGVFELSRQIGVSPWYWWADVPVKKQSSLYINTKAIISDAPKVKYRGIFINDEAPAFSGWTKEKFGGVNHQVYEKVFELILRLKGNYLWPAMWGNAFNDDDTLNPVKADEWGIVMGTSHHEPMLRSQQEWKRYGTGKWDYDSNEVVLRSFWKKGIENMGHHESIITIGMRGDGDKPMTEGTATTLLERIVKDQRRILEEVTQRPAAETPQLWALYKEVQDYYDKGMRVPDDVTLLLCDDNWGNIRKLPRPGEKVRKGGYGIYYHFDYVGGPRNYKWLNTNPIPRVWEQMHLAYEHNVRNIWIVNVGDIKPMEFPISFFLDYAWNPDKISAADIKKYAEQWAAKQFGNVHAKEIASIISAYSKINGRRKPEMLDANTYSLDNYNEAASVVKEYNELLSKAENINALLPAEYRDAFFQLVLHPVKACANLNELYYNVALNKKAYKNKYAVANAYADKVKQLYENDSLISLQYNQLNNGKWNHMMDQTHIGYTYWQQPNRQKMPEVKYVPQDSIVNMPPEVSPDERSAVVPAGVNGNVFYERENHGVSIDASHFSKANNTNGITWAVLPDLGRTGSAITTFPVTATSQKPGANGPNVEYVFYCYSKDSLKLHAWFSPTLNFHNSETGLQYAVSIDDELPQIMGINKEGKNSGAGIWNKWVGENIIIKTTAHKILQPGRHVVKYWMVDAGVVLQKLVIDFGDVKQSYLGPPETIVK